MRRFVSLLVAGLAMAGQAAPGAEPEPLALEGKIALGAVLGRIDHLAIDATHRRLFVAELGNNSVGVVDLKERRLIRRIVGLDEPQGVGYVAATDTLIVANGGDGSVRAFAGSELAPAWRLDLGDDADNVRIDAAAGLAFVGHGTGGLAIIDPRRRAEIAEIALKAHPEAFQLDPAGNRIFVNLPEAHEVAVIERAAGRQIASWPTREASANFPMALDTAGKRVIVVFRRPAKLVAFDESGTVVAEIATCGDADDVFVDPRRNRIYVSCGEGALDVVERRAAEYERIGRAATVAGARTSLFDPASDRLFVAVRAAGTEPAALWVYRPIP
jgi:DNA-binding beta-propeller fold protein YncE